MTAETTSPGRTFREACTDGDLFLARDADRPGREFLMPGCRGIAETLAGVRANNRREAEDAGRAGLLAEPTLRVRLLRLGAFSRIGALEITEDAGLWSVETGRRLEG